MSRLDAMNLSAYKERAVVASNEAKEELKGRRMLSASYRYKHQDSKEFERLMIEQQELFEQARAKFEDEHIDRSDLLVASELAAADANALARSAASIPAPTGEHTATPSGTGSSDQYLPSTTLGFDSSAVTVPTVSGSGRLLGAVTVEDDDNYDE